MRSLVVLLCVCSMAFGSYLPLPLAQLAQPAHHPAVVLDPHGRPLDTAEVIAARALHLQAKHLEHAPLAHAPLPLLSYHGLGYSLPLAHSHLLKKRSLGHVAYAAPVLYAAPSAVSHQSRVDVHSSPAIVSHAVHAPVVAHAVHAPLVAHVAPAAVSHQSRVDVRTSPAVHVGYAHHAHHAPLALAHSAPLLSLGHHAW